MLNQEKLENHLISMEAAARLMLAEAKKIRDMIEVTAKPEKLDMTSIKYYRRMERILNKKALR